MDAAASDSDVLIKVYVLYGEKYTRLTVTSCETIDSVKRRLHVLEGIPPQKMRLHCSSHPNLELQGSCSLAQYDIANGSFMYLETQMEEEHDDQMQLDPPEITDDPPVIIKAKEYRVWVLLGCGGQILSLQVQSSNTISDLKYMIEDLTGIPPQQQKLFFAQTELLNRFTLADYLIVEEESRLHLEFRSKLIKIFVKSLKEGKTTGLEVNSSDTISKVKSVLDDEQGIPMHLQRILFDGKELDDDATLTECQIMNGVTLDLALAEYNGPMRISVKTGDGKTICLQVSSSCTIGNLKSELEAELPCVPAYRMKLYYHGKQLENGHTLDECGIHKGSTLNLHVIHRGALEILVKDFTAKTILCVKLKSTDTVSRVKALIQAKEGIPAEQQLLLFEGKQLDDNHILGTYYITDGSTLYFLPISRGKIQVLIKMPEKAATVVMEVDSLDTIGKVKGMIRALESVPSSQHLKLFVEGKELQNCHKIADYNITCYSVLELALVPGGGSLQVAVTSQTGSTTVILKVKRSDTVGHLKAKIWAEEGFSIHDSSLLFNGKFLDESQTLEQINIKNNSTLTLARRLHRL